MWCIAAALTLSAVDISLFTATIVLGICESQQRKLLAHLLPSQCLATTAQAHDLWSIAYQTSAVTTPQSANSGVPDCQQWLNLNG